MAPQFHMQVSLTAPASWEGNGQLDRRPELSHYRRKRPQGAKPRERPLDTLPRWPPASSWVATPRSPRTSIPAPSIKRTLLSNPEGPRKGTCTGQHATHWWQPAGG